MDTVSESMLIGGESQRNGNCKNDNDVNSCSNREGEGEGEVEAEGEGEGDSAAATEAATRSTTKGFGLKKWRRIRRKDQFKETVNRKEIQEKDSDSESTGRMLKRVLNENEKKKEKENENDVYGSKFVVGSTSNDNIKDNSDEDRTHTHTHRSLGSSKSLKDKLPHHRKTKDAAAEQLKSLDPLKKPRESSPLSSMESDSRSSTASVFIRSTADPIPTTTTTTTTKPPSNPLSFDSNFDPLLRSIFMLQSAQLALQTEVQKFEEIGKDICSVCDDTDKTISVPILPTSVTPVVSEFNNSYSSKIVQTLERQLNEAEGCLKEKELRISELETLMKMESPQDCVRSAMEQQYQKYTEMEAELQDLFKQKLEAAVQTIVITRSAKESSFLVEDQTELLRLEKLPVGQQTQSARMMVDAENTAVKIRGKIVKSDTPYTGSLGGEEIAKMQRRVFKFTSCLFIQLVLLVFAFALFVLQLVPKSALVVPT